MQEHAAVYRTQEVLAEGKTKIAGIAKKVRRQLFFSHSR